MRHILVKDSVVDTIINSARVLPSNIPDEAIEVEDDSLLIYAGYLVSGDDESGWEFTAPPKPNATEKEIKGEAQRRILSVYPYSKQNNMSAHQGELLRIETGKMRDSNGDLIAARELTSGEISELVAIKAVWDWIVSVRAASNTIESDPPTYDELASDPRWPVDLI